VVLFGNITINKKLIIKKMVLNIDFDGTVVEHKYPDIGEDIGAVPVLKKLVDSGHQLILFTMRDGKELNDAIEWFKMNDIPLYGIQTNPTQKEWTTSPKSYANLMIDDSAIGVPLKYPSRLVGDYLVKGRPYVDWVEVEAILIKMGLIKDEK
jgi:hypothetical protein